MAEQGSHTSTRNAPHYCSRNVVANTDPGSGTNAATLGIKTTVSSSEANPAAPPVQPNTPANTNAANINSNNPGVHVKADPCASLHSGKVHHHKNSHSSGG